MKSIVGVVTISLLFAGCMSNTPSRLNLSEFNKNINTKIEIPDECRDLYKNEKAKVAVVNFTNNSTFSSANVNDKNSNTDYEVGIRVIGVGASKDKTNYQTKRLVDPKLASAFIPSIEEMLKNSGGVELFERADYDKIDAELKFQDSGLLDEDSVVEFGKTSGVKYLVTGSIDYVEHNFKSYSKSTDRLVNATRNVRDRDTKLAVGLINFASSLFDGTKVKTGVTVKVIDVATGKIVFSKKSENETKLSSSKKPSYGELVGAVKANINEALPKLKNEFSAQFATKGYISKAKAFGDQKAVQISLGKKDSVRIGDKYYVSDIAVSTDPLTGKSSCELSSTNTVLQITNNISENRSWGIIVKGSKDIKLLQIVEKANDSASTSLMNKLF